MALTVLTASPTSRFAPRGESHEPLRSRCATITGARAARAERGQQRVQATDPVVAEPGALLGVPVDLDDGVVDIDHAYRRSGSVAGSAGRHRQQRGAAGQRDQEPGGDRVELADVAEGERPQERPQRRRRVDPREHPAHPAVPQQRHVIDRVRAGDHPGDQRGDLQPGVRALVGRHPQVLIGQVPQPGRLGQRQHRDQPRRRHQIRIVEHHRGRPQGVRELHLRDALPGAVDLDLSQVPISQHGRASRVTARSTHRAHRWIRA